MTIVRYGAMLLLAATLAGCTGSSTGRNLFGTPSSNNISSMSMHFQTAPSRSNGLQIVPLEIDAYDKWGHLITIPYSSSITLSTNNSCAVQFEFYTPNGGGGVPLSSLTTNVPQVIAVLTNPNCPGPNPATITAVTPNVPPATLQY